jgi:hypothetical protein
MGPGLTAAGAAVLAAAGVILAGCSGQGGSHSAPATPPPPRISSATVADPGPLPPPEALTDVMNRLADPAVPGTDKLPLLQNSAPPDATILDQFSAALRDGGFSPVVFKVTDVRWADQPGDVLATVAVTTTNPADHGEFSFPMEFSAGAGGWQLSRETAEMLLAFGNARQPAPTPTR